MTERSAENRRELEHVGDLVDRVLASVSGRGGLGGARALFSEWETVAGEHWATTTPVRLDGDVLHVAVPSGIMATRLRYATGPLIARIADRLGPDVVSSVRIRVQRPGREEG